MSNNLHRFWRAVEWIETRGISWKSLKTNNLCWVSRPSLQFPVILSFTHLTCVSHSVATLCDPMHCSPPGSSVCGILQARTLEWVAISFSTQQQSMCQIQILVPIDLCSSWKRIWLIIQPRDTRRMFSVTINLCYQPSHCGILLVLKDPPNRVWITEAVT